jgi:hypothetical protein
MLVTLVPGGENSGIVTFCSRNKGLVTMVLAAVLTKLTINVGVDGGNVFCVSTTVTVVVFQ